MSTDWNNIEDFKTDYDKWVEEYNSKHDIPIEKKEIIYDGFIGEKEEFEGVLFILAEAHDEDSIGGEKAFWIKEVINHRCPMYHGRRFLNKLWIIQKAISLYKDKDKNVWLLEAENNILGNKKFNAELDDLRKTAVINLKKIGGGNQVNATAEVDGMTFDQWVYEFRIDLANQIKRIKPKHIIVCGGASKHAFNEYVKPELSDVLESVKIYYSYHPSCRYGYRKFLQNISEAK